MQRNVWKLYTVLFLLICSVSFLFASKIFFNKGGNKKHVIGAWGAGFGSCFHAVLNHIVYCDSKGKIPVVYWDNRSLYYNPQGFNNSYNVWEYYFEPVSHVQYVVGDPVHYSYSMYNYYGPFHYHTAESKRHIASQLIHKYIKIKPIVQKKIDQFYNTYMAGKKTIGIHLRGTDKFIEEKLIGPKRIIAEALKHFEEDMQFLLATDEQLLLDNMIQLLQGTKVIYYDCYRSPDGTPLHNRKMKPSPAQLGEDVLVEILLLSKCDLFIHTQSNVSAMVLYFNSHLKHIVLQ